MRKNGSSYLSVAVTALLLTIGAGGPPSQAQGSDHKLVAAPGSIDERRDGVHLLADYGSYRLYQITDEALKVLPPAVREKVQIADGMDVIHLDAYPLNTRTQVVQVPPGLEAVPTVAPTLHLVQFVGPIRQAWLDELQSLGVKPVQYIDSNAYLVWASASQRETLDALAAKGSILQYSGPYHPYYKLGPSLRGPLSETPAPDRAVPVTIQILSHDGVEATRAWIEAASLSVDSAWAPVLSYQNVATTVPLSRIAEIAALPDVTWVGERLPRQLMDEVQDQIVAGSLNGPQTGPSAPGYKTFIDGKGFSTDPTAYPIVVLTDDGVGTGAVAAGAGDPTLTVLGAGATTRLTSTGNCTTDADAGSVGGHGHINTSIVGGYDTRTGSPFQDANGYQLGMGLSPYGRMAQTKIFTNGGSYSVSNCGGTDAGVIAANWNTGAKISSNSWGCSGCASSYDDSSQAYDAGTRDALPGTAGNQELLFVFAAGNSGSGSATVGTPGNGKNMITVGASESFRPTWTDGCAVGPTGADNAMDVIDFSSRGPSPGGRVKPEVIAPGTHIQGTASTNAGYNGTSVCDQYQPGAQTTFAASSGTSHSTPAVAGMASLYYRWLQDHDLMAPPSPALIKAYMMAHTTYLTGVSANDTLPSNSQGYGMPNLKMGFDDSIRYLVDQSVVFDNSGETWTFNGSVADPSRPVRIVLVYTDAPGAIGTSPQVNNLDLTATVGGSTYLGNHFSGQFSTTGGTADTANNYEGVFLPSGTSGALSITINAFNIAGDGVPNQGDGTDQDFALVCYNCAQFPDFTLGVTPTSRSICAPADAAYDIDIGSILAFNEPATLSTTGLPAGATESYTVNPVTPPGTSQLTVGTGAVAPGSYSFDLVGTSATKMHSRTLALTVFDANPGAPTLLTPANAATNQPLRPVFTWSAPAQAETYTIEIATDAGFSSIVSSQSGLTSATHTPSGDLPSNTVLYWRVRSSNACGTGSDSSTFSFTTLPLPGDCPLGSTALNVYFIDFESGATGWTSSGTGNTWALSTARSWSATHSYFAADPATVSDQQLVSPAVTLPLGQNPLNLIFYNWQTMEVRSAGGCYDGGIIEVSTAGPGGPWTQLNAELLTDPYDGVITASTNPLNGLSGWCGPEDWTRNVVDLSAYAGQTVNIRLHLGSDSSVSREGWYVDDVRFQSCSQGADFTLTATPATRAVCAPTTASYSVSVGSLLGFNEPVTLTTAGVPAGATESYTVNPVNPPGASQLDIGTAGVAAGTYPLTITGTSPSKTHDAGVSLTVYTAAPAGPTLLTPANAATNQPLRPNFTWSAVAQAASYTIEIASDPGFSTILNSQSGIAGTSYTPGSDLPSNTILYWRVRGTNLCSDGPNSSVFYFTTLPLPGDCPQGSVASSVYFIDFENGATGWTSGGTGNTWALSTARSWSATHSYFAADPATVSDQQLVSPAVALPAGQNPLNLIFYTWQEMEPRTGGCFDGGILEVSTAGPGGPWTQLQAQLLTDPYDGPISASFSNPLANLNAWCGPEDWTRSVVDLSAYAGQTVNMRWRLGSDTSASREGWYVDDVKFQSCLAGQDFTLAAAPASREVCAATTASYAITVGSILGFNEPVTLTTAGVPAGATESYTVNPVNPPGASQLDIGTTGVAAGTYPLTITGTSPSKTHNVGVSLKVYSAAPAGPALLTPANGATNQALRPTFTWSAAAQASTYTIEIASNAGFSIIVNSASGLTGTSYTPGVDLPSSSVLYWRVRATNGCGVGANSAVFSFSTLALPGDCPVGKVASSVYFTNFESGAAGWTSGGTGNTWAISTARSWSATHSYFASDPAAVSDQQLVSPPIALPVGQNPLNLSFYNWQTIESRTGGCYDGGILEISTAGPGGPWTQIQAQIVAQPYDGPISASFSNPMANLNAWCGNPRDWTRAVVDLSAFAGQTVNMRWRLGSDISVGKEGWYIDDVKFQSCNVPAVPIPPVPDGMWVPGTQMKAQNPPGNGSTIQVTWDSSTCTGQNYNLYYGMGTQLPAALGGIYGLSGSVLGLGTNGTAGYTWLGTPDPSPDPSRLLWWVVVATDNVSTEGSWGRDSQGTERKGPGTGGSSNQGPFVTKDTSHSSCP